MKSKLANTILIGLMLVALQLAAAPPAPAGAGVLMTAPGKVEKALLDKILANPDGRFDAIVMMQPGSSGEAKGTVSQAGGANVRGLPVIGGGSGSLSGRAILAMATNSKVGPIFEDSKVKLLGTPVATISTASVRAPEVWDLGYTGKGIGVAVLDSGVATHADLTSPSNRIVASVNMAGGKSGADDVGHGTHVAGIIAGNGNASKGARQGIAPQANIISVKVADDTGAATYSSVIAGIQWVIGNRRAYNIRVMNLSLGGPVTRPYYADPLNAALDMAWFSGVVVVAAAGNNGPNAGTITSPGNNPYIITVGALDDAGTVSGKDDVMPDFSSRGPTAIDRLPKPDLVAPGRRVISLRAAGSYLDRMMPDRVVDSVYFRLTGTSQAAPVVAGVIALILEKDPGLSPNQVKYILTGTARKLAYDANTAGAGAVDALSAVTFKGDGQANQGQRPSSIFARTIFPLVKGSRLAWKNASYQGRNWTNYTWDKLPWDNYTWDNFAWENIDWQKAAWSNFTWDNFTWDNFTWDNFTWDNFTWDNFTWDNFTLD